MSQSLAKVYVHIIFSTKHREKLITVSIKEELFSYIGGICKELECDPIIVGGHQDHIHILCVLSKKIALMKLIQEAKQSSSKWIKTKGNEFKYKSIKICLLYLILGLILFYSFDKIINTLFNDKNTLLKVNFLKSNACPVG